MSRYKRFWLRIASTFRSHNCRRDVILYLFILLTLEFVLTHKLRLTRDFQKTATKSFVTIHFKECIYKQIQVIALTCVFLDICSAQSQQLASQ